MDRILPYWSANMVVLWDSGMTWWPGFNYSEEEQALMRTQAARVFGRGKLYSLMVAVIFITGLCLVVPGIMVPVLTSLYPDPSQTSPLVFAGVLATIAALSLGLWLPLAMALAAGTVNGMLGDPPTVAIGPAERNLSRRIKWQIQRMALIMSGLLVPGVMAFIVFDIDTQKGPIHYAIVAADVLIAIGTALYLRAAGKRRQGQ